MIFYTGVEAWERWNEFIADMWFNAFINLYFAPYMYLGKQDEMLDTFKSICKI